MLQPRTRRWRRRLTSYVTVLASRARSRRRDTVTRAAQGWSFLVRDQHRHAWTLRAEGKQLHAAAAAAEASGDSRTARRRRRIGDRVLRRAAAWDAKARAESQRLVRTTERQVAS